MKPQFLLVGLDEKVTWDDGQIRFLAPGHDSLCIFDTSRTPATPQLVATLALPNSLFGPPTNLAVTPDNRLGLIADSMHWEETPDGWQPQPGRNLHVIDLAASPPVIRQTITIGLQPSGLAINRAGTLALVANRSGQSVSVLSIAQGRVQHEGDVAIGSAVVAVSFSADGARAFVAKLDAHRLGVLHIDGTDVRYDRDDDLVTGLVPYNLVVSPDGRRALTVDMGSATASDGHADTVSVIDLTLQPARVVDKVMVEDGPEGIAISPDGRYVAVAIVQGSNTPSAGWIHHPHGQVVLLRVDTQTVTRVDAHPVGALPEGIAFSPCSRYLYVGNFLDAELQILEIQHDRLVEPGPRMPLPGHPASMRSQAY